MAKLKLKNTNLTRKSHIPTNNLDINKKVVSEKVFSGKKNLKCFIGYENAKQLDLYAYSFQKWVDVKEILKEPNIYVFFDKKSDELSGKYNEVCEKVSNNIKKEFNSEPVGNVISKN